MIDLDSKAKLCIKGSVLVPEQGINENTHLAATIREWNLLSLAAIITTDTLVDDSARQEALHKTRRTQNILMGGVVGGLLDSESGDDTIADGVLLGAVFGSICTGDANNPTAQMGLVFRDGTSLAVEVDRSEFTRLQTILAANSFRKSQESPGFCDRKLTEAEMEEIVSCRENRAGALNILMFVFLAAITPVGIYFLGFDALVSELLINILTGAGIVIATAFMFVKTMFAQKKESLMLDETERHIFESLKRGTAGTGQVKTAECGQ